MKGSKKVAAARPGAVKKVRSGQVGSGGQGRQALEGKGPTPKAEDRPYHPAGKRKAALERYRAAGGTGKPGTSTRGTSRSGGVSEIAPRGAAGASQRAKAGDGTEIVTGRNAVLEALRTRIPATALYLASRIDLDDRVKEAISLATKRELAIIEVTRPELDRMAGDGGVHQGIGLKVPPYRYAHPLDLLDKVTARGERALFVALDGVTDPRNLGAIIRSTGAFGGHGVIVPQRRSVGVTAAAWKTSAGAAARIPVAMATNLTQVLAALQKRGVFVVGLDGEGSQSLGEFALGDRPLCLVVGSEGKGLSRLVTETCDVVVRIPISAATESLNAGIAASVALYQVSLIRSV